VKVNFAIRRQKHFDIFQCYQSRSERSVIACQAPETLLFINFHWDGVAEFSLKSLLSSVCMENVF